MWLLHTHEFKGEQKKYYNYQNQSPIGLKLLEESLTDGIILYMTSNDDITNIS